MSRIPLSPPPIPKLDPSIKRFTVSVMIPIYNGSAFLEDAIKSVLCQDLGEDVMQIEVVDDCSTDADVEAMVIEVGKGRVKYYRQPQNVGSLRNFETCINRARGEYIHLLHCDDRVKKGFYETMLGLFEQFPEAGAAFCGHDSIDHSGSFKSTTKREAETPCILPNLLDILAERQPIQYVSIIVKRHVYEDLGSFYGVTYGEDWIMWARIAQKYPVAYTPIALAEYRSHAFTISTNSITSGKNLHDMAMVIDTVTSLLPLNEQKIKNKAARRNYVYYSLVRSESMYWHKQLPKPPYKQLVESVKFYNDLSVSAYVMRILLRMWIRPIKRRVIGKG